MICLEFQRLIEEVGGFLRLEALQVKFAPADTVIGIVRNGRHQRTELVIRLFVETLLPQCVGLVQHLPGLGALDRRWRRASRGGLLRTQQADYADQHERPESHHFSIASWTRANSTNSAVKLCL